MLIRSAFLLHNVQLSYFTVLLVSCVIHSKQYSKTLTVKFKNHTLCANVRTYTQMNMSSSMTPLEGVCNPGTPYSDFYEHHEKVFVVAESDDTYVYHLHLGNSNFLVPF